MGIAFAARSSLYGSLWLWLKQPCNLSDFISIYILYIVFELCTRFEAGAGDSIETRASLITQNLKLADPCTFRILVKNTTLLMAPEDPLRVEAYSVLDTLVRCASS